VPEIAITKYGNALGEEYDVWLTGEIGTVLTKA
jgi:hypothetical protein